MLNCIRDSYYSVFTAGPANRYRFDGRIFGFSEAIYCLAISSCGELLAAGDSEGTRLWDLKTRKEVETPPPVEAARGPVTAMSWCPRAIPSVMDDILCFGTALGHLVIWHKMDDEENFDENASKCVSPGEEITTIALEILEAGSIRIAVGSTCGSVQLWTYDQKDHSLRKLFKTQLASTTPKAVAFEQNITKDIYVFGLYDGVVLTLNGNDGTPLSARPSTKNMISGSAAIDIRRRVVAIDNCETGIDILNLESLKLIRHFPTGRSKRVFPLQVVFAEDSKVVVSGSSNGAVYVFDRKTGRPMDVLHHTAEDGMVQTVATYEKYGVSYIISASSGEDNNTPFIAIWRCDLKKRRSSRFWWLLALGSIAIIVGNLVYNFGHRFQPVGPFVSIFSESARSNATTTDYRTRTVYFTGPTVTRTRTIIASFTSTAGSSNKSPGLEDSYAVIRRGVDGDE